MVPVKSNDLRLLAESNEEGKRAKELVPQLQTIIKTLAVDTLLKSQRIENKDRVIDRYEKLIIPKMDSVAANLKQVGDNNRAEADFFHQRWKESAKEASKQKAFKIAGWITGSLATLAAAIFIK